jgi:hypothetical protein
MLNTVLRIVKQAPIGKLALDVGDFAIRDGKKMAPWAIPAAIAGIESSLSSSKARNYLNNPAELSVFIFRLRFRPEQVLYLLVTSSRALVLTRVCWPSTAAAYLLLRRGVQQRRN